MKSSALLALCALAFPSAAQCSFDQLLANSGVGVYDTGGEPAAIDGDWIAVRVVPDVPAPVDVLMFERVGTEWVLSDTVVAQDVLPGESVAFGSAIDLDGDTLVVGAESDGGGAVHVYGFDGESWVPEGKLTSPNAGSDAAFGRTVALQGDVLAVGAPVEFGVTGRTYVFRRDGLGAWALEQTLTAPGPTSFFGSELALDDDVIVAVSADDVHVYRYDGVGTWAFEETLTRPAKATVLFFGSELALADGVLIVSDTAIFSDTTGTAFVYVDGGAGWGDVQQLAPPDLIADDRFGQTLAFDGTHLLVGAPGHDAATIDAGAVYLFEWTGTSFTQLAKVLPPVPRQNARFGELVDLDGTRSIVTAGNEDLVGALWSFDDFAYPSPEPWADLGGGVGGLYGVPELAPSGHPCAEFTVELDVVMVRENTFAYYVVGTSVLGVPFKGGTMVPTPSFISVPIPTGTGGGIETSFTWPANAPSDVSLVIQVWIQDALGPAGFAASNGVSIDVP